MKKLQRAVCIALVIILGLTVPLFPSGYAADLRFGRTIASANGRVYVVRNDSSLWYWGKATFNDSAGDQSPDRGKPVQMMNNIIGVYGDWWSGFSVDAVNNLWAISYGGLPFPKSRESYDPPEKYLSNVIEAACQYDRWIALKTDGTVWTWNYSSEPKEIMSNVKQVSACIDSYYALRTDGSLWGWGDNYSGYLGLETGNTYMVSPVRIMKDVSFVLGTGTECYAIKTDGSLWGWGRNYDGIIFTGEGDTWAFDPYDDGSQSVVTAQFTPVKLMDDVIAVDGRNHMAVIKKDHNLWTWGNNGSGELGDGTTVSRYIPQKVMDNVVDVTARGAFTVALKNDGTLWGCGTNSSGELGLGEFDFDPHSTFIKIFDNIAIPYSTADFPSSWAQTDITRATSLSLVPPTLQSKYTQPTTRAEFCALAVALYEKYTGSAITGRTTFTDTTDIDVEKMAYVGVVNGTSPGKFTPSAALTREQAATMLARLADKLDKYMPMLDIEPFSDFESVSPWAQGAVREVQSCKIMNGTSPDKFTPKGPYTREQSIVTMLRMWDYLKG